MSSTQTHSFLVQIFFPRIRWKVKVSIYFFIQPVGVGVLFVWALPPCVLISCDSGFLVHADTVRVTLEYTGVGKSCLSQTTYQTTQMLGTQVKELQQSPIKLAESGYCPMDLSLGI